MLIWKKIKTDEAVGAPSLDHVASVLICSTEQSALSSSRPLANISLSAQRVAAFCCFGSVAMET